MPILFSPGVTEISSQLVLVIASENRLLLEDSEVQFWAFISPQYAMHSFTSCLLVSTGQAIFFNYNTHLCWISQGKSKDYRLQDPTVSTVTILLATIFLNQIEFVSAETVSTSISYL